MATRRSTAPPARMLSLTAEKRIHLKEVEADVFFPLREGVRITGLFAATAVAMVFSLLENICQNENYTVLSNFIL